MDCLSPSSIPEYIQGSLITCKNKASDCIYTYSHLLLLLVKLKYMPSARIKIVC